MSKKRRLASAVLALGLLLSLAGCRRSSALTFEVETGDRVRVELASGDGWSLKKSDAGFSVRKDKESVLEGTFLHGEAFSAMLAQGETSGTVLEQSGSFAAVQNLNGTDESQTVFLKSAGNTCIYLESHSGKDLAREAYGRLSLSLDGEEDTGSGSSSMAGSGADLAGGGSSGGAASVPPAPEQSSGSSAGSGSGSGSAVPELPDPGSGSAPAAGDVTGDMELPLAWLPQPGRDWAAPADQDFGIPEQTLPGGGGVTAAVTGVRFAGGSGLQIGLRLGNGTQSVQRFGCSMLNVNGNTVSILFSEDLQPGETRDVDLTVWESELARYGFQDVAAVSGRISVTDADTYLETAQIPLEITGSGAGSSGSGLEGIGDVVLSQGGIVIRACGWAQDHAGVRGIVFMAENHSGRDVLADLSGVQTANGTEAFGSFYLVLMNGTTALASASWGASDIGGELTSASFRLSVSDALDYTPVAESGQLTFTIVE